MKQYFNVSFQWFDTTTYCANIAHAENEKAVEKHYLTKGHKDINVSKCNEYDIETARRKGMPIVEI